MLVFFFKGEKIKRYPYKLFLDPIFSSCWLCPSAYHPKFFQVAFAPLTSLLSYVVFSQKCLLKITTNFLEPFSSLMLFVGSILFHTKELALLLRTLLQEIFHGFLKNKLYVPLFPVGGHLTYHVVYKCVLICQYPGLD